MAAFDSCHKKSFNGIFIYPLKLIPVPNFSSLGWFSFLSAVNSCWQLMTAVTKKTKWDFHLPPKANTCAKFQPSRLLGGPARECDTRQTHRRQVNIELTPALLGWCQGLSWAISGVKNSYNGTYQYKWCYSRNTMRHERKLGEGSQTFWGS